MNSAAGGLAAGALRVHHGDTEAFSGQRDAEEAQCQRRKSRRTKSAKENLRPPRLLGVLPAKDFFSVPPW